MRKTITSKSVGWGGGGGSDKTIKDFAVNDITEQKLPVLAKGTRDLR